MRLPPEKGLVPVMGHDHGELELAARHDPGEHVVAVHEIVPMREGPRQQRHEAPRVEQLQISDIDVQDVHVHSFPLEGRHLLLNENPSPGARGTDTYA